MTAFTTVAPFRLYPETLGSKGGIEINLGELVVADLGADLAEQNTLEDDATVLARSTSSA